MWLVGFIGTYVVIAAVVALFEDVPQSVSNATKLMVFVCGITGGFGSIWLAQGMHWI